MMPSWGRGGERERETRIEKKKIQKKKPEHLNLLIYLESKFCTNGKENYFIRKCIKEWN